MTDIRQEAAVPSRTGGRRCCDHNPILYLRSRFGVWWSLSDPLKHSAAKNKNCKAVHEQQPFGRQQQIGAYGRA